MAIQLSGPPRERLGEHGRERRVQGAVAGPRPGAVERTKPRTGERRLSTLQPRVGNECGAVLAASALVEIPAQLLERLRLQRCRELVAYGVLIRAHRTRQNLRE